MMFYYFYFRGYEPTRYKHTSWAQNSLLGAPWFIQYLFTSRELVYLPFFLDYEGKRGLL